MLFHSKILCGSQCHVRNKQSFYGWVLRGIHERNDTIHSTCVGESVTEEVVVVVCHTHTTQDNLIGFGTHGNECHHFIERLVWVCKERNLLSRHKRIVQVNTSYTCCNQFAWLLTTYRIHGWTSDFHFLTFNLRTTIDGVSIGIEEASCQLLAYFEGWSFSKKNDFCISRNATCTFKHLQGYIVANNLHYLCQFAVNSGKFVISHTCSLQTTSSFGDLTNLCIYFLKCCCHCILSFLVFELFSF